MMRQAILERLGWRFIRIRGSEFFRYPEQTIEKVFARLQAMGIEPNVSEKRESETTSNLNELQERVIRRAAELLSQWQPAKPSEQVPFAGERVSREDHQEKPRIPFAIGVEENANHHKTIDDVTRMELRAAIYQAIPISGSVERDELLRTVTSSIGLSRLGRKIRSRINKTIAAEVRSGRLQTDWKRVWKAGNKD